MSPYSRTTLHLLRFAASVLSLYFRMIVLVSHRRIPWRVNQIGRHCNAERDSLWPNYPSRFAASFTLKIDVSSSPRNRSSLSILIQSADAPAGVHYNLPGVNPNVLSLNLESRLWSESVDHEVVITVRTIFVTDYY